jgi:hypothetical protein
MTKKRKKIPKNAYKNAYEKKYLLTLILAMCIMKIITWAHCTGEKWEKKHQLFSSFFFCFFVIVVARTSRTERFRESQRKINKQLVWIFCGD